MIQDSIKVTGELKITVTNPNGNVTQETVIPNLVVTSGKDYIAERMKDATTTAMSHMAIGSGNTAAAAGNTALGTELGRVALTSSTVSNAVVTYVASFAAGTGTGAVTEAGILTAASGGTMLCRTVFSVVNKGSADSMTITWTVTVS